MIRVAVILVTLAATPAAAADQFDLLCQFGKTPVRYRVDLSAGEACVDECEKTWTLGAITSGQIVLRDTRDTPTEIPQTYVVDRRTGELVHWTGGIGRAVTERATCTSAPFSGLPAAKF